jgi:4-hydroxy-2-oxoheptanedioate aldolase
MNVQLFNHGLKKRLYEHQTCLGTWLFLPSPEVVEIVALAGFDFAVIDMEHSPTTHEQMVRMIVAAESKSMTPLVRVPDLSASLLLKTLDSGAHGVQLPHIDTPEEARMLVKYVKYHPDGERGMAPSTRAGGFTLKTDQAKLSLANESGLVVISLESAESLRNLPEILEVQGIDVIYIGPYDLSQSLGLPGQVEHPVVLKEMETVFRRIRDAGKIAGSFAHSAMRARQLKNMGVHYLTCETDGTLLRQAFENLKKEINHG